MKSKNQKTNRTLKLGLKILIGGIIGLSFGFGVGKMVKSNSRLGIAMENTLQQNCHCEKVISEGGAVGLQFSKKEGFSNSSKEFTIENAAFPASVEKEALRLHSILENDVADYTSVDLITFHFKTENTQQTVKIKDGNVLSSN